MHPLFTSKNGAILWKELPEAFRLFDNPKAGQPGDLELYLDGFGHLLDRAEATMAQFMADGFASLDPEGRPGHSPQGWVIPYMADLFGVTLYGPDPGSRRSELAQAIWVARRRGSRLAVDHAAESILETAVATVPGLERVLYTPSLRAQILTQAEITGQPHPKDAVLLREPPPAGASLQAIRSRHAGLPLGRRALEGRMRAVRATGFEIDVDSRPAPDAAGQLRPTPYRILHREGAPCFPGTHEDRTLRSPDIRGPGPNRRPGTLLSRPDAVYLHVMPPTGLFGPNLMEVASPPAVENGHIVLPEDGGQMQDIFFRPPPSQRTLRLTEQNRNATSQRHEIAGLRFDGELVVAEGMEAILTDCAIRVIRQEEGSRLTLRHSACERIEADVPDARTEIEYVTVTERLSAWTMLGSDCILVDLAIPPGGPPGCLRYSRVASGLPPAAIAFLRSTTGPVEFLGWPCLPSPGGGPPVSRVAGFGEPGYAVLSDAVPPGIANGAEDGSEPGVHHDRFHLARLSAAARRAQDTTPAGHRVFARYDLRLAAPLPRIL